MSTEVTLLTRLQATDEAAAADLAGRLQVLVATVPTEPGNLAYAVYRTEEDRTLFYIEESWSAPADAARHIDSIAADPSAQEVSGLLVGPVQTVTLSALHATTADREVLRR